MPAAEEPAKSVSTREICSPDLWIEIIEQGLPQLFKAIRAPDVPAFLQRSPGYRAPGDPPFPIQRALDAITAYFSTDSDIARLEAEQRRHGFRKATDQWHAEALYRLRQCLDFPHPHLALTALANWQTTKGIYRFDANIAKELIRSAPGEIDSSALRTLPEWTTYIDLTGLSLPGHEPRGPLVGMFVHLLPEMSQMAARMDPVDPIIRHQQAPAPTLLVVFDQDDRLVPATIPLLPGRTIGECIESQAANAEQLVQSVVGAELTGPLDLEGDLAAAQLTGRLLSLPLYLCQPEPDVSGRWPPPSAQPSKIKKGKWILPPTPRVCEVGVRLGAQMRRHAESTPQTQASGIGVSPAPHIRRAHWHGYWTGPKDDPAQRRMIAKWLPPTPVNLQGEDEADLPAVIRDAPAA